MREEAWRLKEKALLNTDADARFGESLRGDELPEELRRREDRLTAIVAAKERAAQRELHGHRPEWERHPKGGQPRAYGEPEDRAQGNFTEPDSGMTSAEGFQRNAQVAGEHQLIVTTELTISDQGGGAGSQGDLRRAARDGARGCWLQQ